AASTIAPIARSVSAWSNASTNSRQSSISSALRFSGRLSVTSRTRPCCVFSSVNFDLHAQQRCAESLPLRIDSQRYRAASAEGLMQQQIDRPQVGKLEALDFPFDESAEEFFDARRRDFAHDDRIVFGLESDHADVRCVSFIARTGMGNG